MKSIFIVGYWNSGTTLLVDILRKHPEIKLKNAKYKPNLEEQIINKILQKLGSSYFNPGDYSEIIENGFTKWNEPCFDEEQKLFFRKEFLSKFKVNKDKWLLLKNPYLFFFPNFLKQNFEGDIMKKIIILRNGRSQAVSKDYWLRKTDSPEKKLIDRTLFWNRCMEYYYENWHNDENCHTIRYENLCAYPEDTLREVFGFLDIDPDAKGFLKPAALENRMTKWDNLDDELKEKVLELIHDTQAKIDKDFPVL